MSDMPTNSVEYYRYLEQDERDLAELATSEKAKLVHVQFADQYGRLARIAEQGKTAAAKAA
jgi:hypothetical protein